MIKAVLLEQHKIRIIRGHLVPDLDIDWNIQSLDTIENIVRFVIDGFAQDLPILKQKKYKNLEIYRGGSHIDIIENGKGSLYLLRVEDHFSKDIGSNSKLDT